MNYEIDKIKSVAMYDKTIGEELAQFTISQPPKPNTMFIISNGYDYGGKTVFYIYRPKRFNWFQRLMWKVCFGITIKLGEDLSI